MKVIDPGHVYELANLASEDVQTLTFIKKAPVAEGSTELKTILPGTTNEEVLQVLGDRLRFLNGLLPDSHTEAAIDHIDKALSELIQRTAERKDAGVEGTHAPMPQPAPEATAPTNPDGSVPGTAAPDAPAPQQ